MLDIECERTRFQGTTTAMLRWLRTDVVWLELCYSEPHSEMQHNVFGPFLDSPQEIVGIIKPHYQQQQHLHTVCRPSASLSKTRLSRCIHNLFTVSSNAKRGQVSAHNGIKKSSRVSVYKCTDVQITAVVLQWVRC